MHVFAQIGTWNPALFPADPLQLSNGLDVMIGGGALSYGSGGSGVILTLFSPPQPGSELRFLFDIPGP